MTTVLQRLLGGLVLLHGFSVYAQSDSAYYKETVKPRIRVIIDNDFGGDPDGLFQLAHHILSPSVEIRGIIGSQHYESGFYESPGTAAFACTQVRELLRVMRSNSGVPVYEGGRSGLTDPKTPVISEGAKAIVKEAMREDTQMPLFVVCGAGLTNLASAFLIEPGIAGKITLVWIGGAEYPGLAIPPPDAMRIEYNLGIDIKAVQVIFNTSEIPIWQIPRDAYRLALYPYSELILKIKTNGATGNFLATKLEGVMRSAKGSLGETYVLGDSPLVLLTALQSSWEADPSFSHYVIKPAPVIDDGGQYQENMKGRPIRVYTRLDTRLMFEDFIAKLSLLNFKK